MESAREKCRKLGGQHAIIPAESTRVFIKEIANGLHLRLGATSQPDNTDGIENHLQTFDTDSRWNDGAEGDRFVVCFIRG